MSEKCNNDEAQEPTMFHGENDASSWFDWKMAMMGYGSRLVICFSIGYTVFTTGRPYWFVSMFERKQSKKIRRLIRNYVSVCSYFRIASFSATDLFG